MPITNQGGAGTAGSSDQILSRAGYNLGLPEYQSGANDLISAYRQLVQLQQNQTKDIANQNQGQQENPFVPPDTTGWRDMNPWEQAVHGMAEFGDSISDLAGFGEKWEETKEKQAAGKADLGDYAETGIKFLGSLPGMFLGGGLGVLEDQTEAWGGANLQESYDGKVSPTQLTGEQRAASGLSSFTDILSMIPGVGLVGTGAKVVGGVGKALLKSGVKEAVEEGAEQVAKQGVRQAAREGAEEAGEASFKKASENFFNQTAAQKIGQAFSDSEISKVAKRHPFASKLVTEAASEGGQEIFQSFAEDVRGQGEEHGLEQIQGENFDEALNKALESGAWGALGGAAAHTGITIGNKMIDTLKDQAEKRAANSDKMSLAETNRAIEQAKSSFSSMEAPLQQYEEAKDNQVATAIARDIESKQSDKMRKNLGYSGTAVGDQRAYGDYMVPSAVNVMATVNHNSTRDAVLNHIFGDETGLYWNDRLAFIEAARNNNIDEGTKILNRVAKARDDAGDAIECLFYKQPANNETPIKGKIREFSSDPNIVGVDEAIMAIANADYDGDLAAMMFDAAKLKNARYFTQTLLKGDGTSTIDWADAHMDIHGWSKEQTEALLGALDMEFGDKFTQKVMVTIPSVNNGHPASVGFAIKSINNMVDKDPDTGKDRLKDQRQAAISALFQQIQKNKYNVSNVWRYVQVQSQRIEEIVVAAENRREVKEEAAEKVADPKNFPDKYPIQTSYDPEAFTKQASWRHGEITSINPETEPDSPGNSVMRNNFTLVAEGHRDADIGREGDTGVKASQYELMVLANLDMSESGRHDNAKIMSLYNRTLRDIINATLGKTFQITKDFDIKSERTFPDRLIEELQNATTQYNEAIKEAFMGEVDVSDLGPMIKKMPTRETLPEFLYGIYKDDFTLAELMEPLIKDNPRLQKIPGIDAIMSEYFLAIKGGNLDEMFFNITDSNGNRNENIGMFIKQMRLASDQGWNNQEKKIRGAIEDLELKPLEELEVDLNEHMDKERVKELLESDAIKAFNRISEILGSEVMVKQRLVRVGDWKNNKEVKKYFLYGTKKDRLNFAWNQMFRTHAYPLYYRLSEAIMSGDMSAVRNLVLYMNKSNKNNNPIFQAIYADIMKQFHQDGIFTVGDNGDITYAEGVDEQQIKETASKSLIFVEQMAGYDKSIDEKIKWLNLRYKSEKTGMEGDLPYFVWLRAGLTEDPSELGLSQKIAQADAVSSNFDTVNASQMIKELKELDEYISNAGIKEDEALEILKDMGSNENVTIDKEVILNQVFSAWIVEKASIDKGQSDEATARSVEAIRQQMGLPFNTLFMQNTDALGNAMKATEFCSTRRNIMDCLFGTYDKVNGSKYEKNVFDASVDADCYMSQEEMLGLAEGEEVTYRKIMDFLIANPQVASWMKPMKIQMARVGNVHTVGPRTNSNKSMLDLFQEQRTKVAENKDPKTGKPIDNWGTKKTKKTMLDYISRLPYYSALIMAEIKNASEINTTQAFRKAAEAAKRRVDARLMYDMVNYDKEGFLNNYQEILEDSKLAGLKLIFDTTQDEEVTDSLMAENVLQFTRDVDAEHCKSLMTIIIDNVDPSIGLEEKDSNSGLPVREMKKAARDSLEQLFQNVIMNRLLISNGTAFDPMTLLKDKVRFEEIMGRFKDQDKAKKVYEALNSVQAEEALLGTNLREYMRKYVIDEDVFFDKDGNPRREKDVMDDIKKYACKNKYFNVEPSYIANEIKPKVHKLYEGLDPDEDPDVYRLDVIAQLHKKVALEYYRGEAQRRNKTFDASGVALMDKIISEIVPEAKALIQREVDPRFFDKLDNVSIPYAPPLNPQWFDPFTANAIIRLLDFQTSGDTAMRIAYEGQTPKFMSSTGFLMDYCCNQGTTCTISDLANLDLSKQGRYAVVFQDDSVAEKIEGFKGAKKITLTKANYKRLQDAIKNGQVEETQAILLIDRDDQVACTSGICADHAPKMIEFIQRTMAFGQEARAMKLKKKFQILNDSVKGIVNKRRVIKRRAFSESLSSIKIYNEWKKMVDDYARAIRQCATEGVFAKNDEDIDWNTWSIPFAKMMIPCVKVTFKNGDTCSLGIKALKNEQVLDPLYNPDANMTTHQEYIDWSQVETVDMRILGAEELSTHIIDAITAAEIKADAEGTKIDYAAVAEDAFENWRTRNRYCKETGETKARLTAQDIVNNIRFLSSSLYDPPTLNILPATYDRFLGIGNTPVSPQLKRETMNAGTHGITQDMIDNLKAILPVGDSYISHIFTDKKSSGPSAEYLDAYESIKVNEAHKKADEHGGFINGSMVLVDYANPTDHIETIKNCVYRAAKYDAELVIPENSVVDLMNALNMPEGSSLLAYATVELNGEKFSVFKPSRLVTARNTYQNGPRMGIYKGHGEPYRVFLDCPGYGPIEDSFIAMTKEQAEKWLDSIEARENTFDLGNLGGRKPTILESFEDLDALSEQVDKLLEASRKQEKEKASERKRKKEEEKKRKEEGKEEKLDKDKDKDSLANRDLVKEAYELFDFSASNTGDEDISDITRLQRIQKYIEKVEKNKGNMGVLLNVNQGDVIGIAKTGQPGNYKYYPITYQGSVPVTAGAISINSSAITGNKVKYRYSYTSSLADGNSFKQYLKDVDGVKAQAAQTVDYEARLTHGDTEIPTSGFLHHASMASRLTPALEPKQVKLSLFVLLRQYITYDVFENITVDNVRDFFEGGKIGNFDPQDIVDAVHNKTDMVRHIDFWKALATENIKLKGTTHAQRVGMGRLIFAFLNAKTSPAFLFSSKEDGHADGTCSYDWMYVLNEVAGVRLDDVMAFCNFVDDSFCFPDSRTRSDKEFMKSGKFIDSRGRVVVQITEKDGSKKQVMGYARVSRTGSSGSTAVRGISDSQTFNNQLQWLLLTRNGPHGCDCRAAMRGMRAYLSHFSNADIIDLYELDPDIYFDRLVDPHQFTHDTTYCRPQYMFGGKVRSVREEKWRDKISKFYKFYNRTGYPEVWSRKADTAEDIEPYYREIERLYPDISKDLYMRLIMAAVNWTYSEHTDARLNRISLEAFRAAHVLVRDKLQKKHLPLIVETIQLENREQRIGVGAIEPWRLAELCDAMGYDYDAALEEMRHNLEQAKKLVGSLDSYTSKRLNQETSIEYLDAMINGETETSFLDANIPSNDIINTICIMNDSLANSTLSDRDAIKGFYDEGMKLLSAHVNAEKERNNVHYDNENARGGTINKNRRRADQAADRLFEGATKLRQFMAILSPLISMANIYDTFKGNVFQRIGNFMGRQIGSGPYASAWKNAIKIDTNVVEDVIDDKNLLSAIEARKMAELAGEDELARYEAFLEAGHSPDEWIKQNASIKFKSLKGIPHVAYGVGMRIGSGAHFNRKSTARNFIRNFQKVAGEQGLTFLDRNGSRSFERDLLSEKGPAAAINELFRDPVTRQAAEIAWNMTMQGSMGQVMALSWFGDRLTQNRAWMKFIGCTVGGVPFFNATVNLTFRTLKNIIPGMSTMNYLAVQYLEENPQVFSSDGPLGRILRAAGQVDGDTLHKEFAADADALKLYTNLREAMLVDLCHMTLPMFGVALALGGFLEPPDDDDRYDNYEEWRVFGTRIGAMWWMKDIIGPILPWACYFKSLMDGNPSGGIMFNGMCDFINMSPFLTGNNAIQLVLEPDSALEVFEKDQDWYSDSKYGKLEWPQYFTGNVGPILLSYAASFITPKVVTDISTYLPPFEVSYNRKFSVNQAGEMEYMYDGVTPKTEKVSYGEAQLRKLTKNNFLLGSLFNLLPGMDKVNGWTFADMPAQEYTEPAQISFMELMSVWDYDNDKMKTDDEIAEVCTAIVMILDQNDDMDALYHEGFYLDSMTKQAVSEYIWDLYQQEIDEWNAIVQEGGTNPYILGNGDFNAGLAIKNAMYAQHSKVLSYYKNDLYYGKLRSDELNQGLVRYNRYNTTFAQDKDGDWYATGFQQNVNPFMPGFFFAPQEGTAGNEGSWATLSEVTGLGMYDEDGDPMRALVPTTDPDTKWMDWDELGGGDKTNGKSPSYPTWSPNELKQLLGLATGGSKGGYGYSRRGGGGGGGRGGGSGYSRTANANRGQGSRVYAAPYTSVHRNTGAHNVNFNRPNLAYVMDAKRINDPNLDYLRPNFETKGSREAYKRGDF